MRRKSDMKPTLAIVVTSFLSHDGQRAAGGGRPRIVRDLARYFTAQDYDVTIVQRGERSSLIPYEENISVHVVKAPKSAWGDLWFARAIRAEVRAATVCCYASPEDGFPFDSPNAFAIQHGVWWDSPEYSGPKRLAVHAVQRLRNAAMCRRTKAVICVDSNFANTLRLDGPLGHELAAKCFYLPNYVDLKAFPAPHHGRLLQRFWSRKLLFLRRLEPPRGPRLIVEVCRLLRDNGVAFAAELCGWGSEREATSRLIAEYRLETQVGLSEAALGDAATVADAAAVSVVPSLWSEGTSLSAIESIAQGIPVVASDVGGLANVVIPGFNGYICPSTAPAFAERIRRLLDDEDEYLRLAHNCLALREVFSFERWIRELTDRLAQQGIIPTTPHLRTTAVPA